LNFSDKNISIFNVSHILNLNLMKQIPLNLKI
jgi:hypothetical protein